VFLSVKKWFGLDDFFENRNRKKAEKKKQKRKKKIYLINY